jgi:hypothetical protein
MKPLIIGLIASLMLATASQAQVNSTWNGTSGNWSDFTRWSSNPLFPNDGNGGNDYNAVINGGTVNVNIPITIEKLNVGGGGTITRANDLIVKGNFDWISGNVTGGGLLEIGGGGRLFGNLSVSDGPIRFGDGVNASSFILTNSGALLLNNGAHASVQNGTTYEIAGSSSNFGSNTSGTPGAFTVEAGGVLRKTGDGTHQIANNVALNNYGIIEVTRGILAFDPSTVPWANAGQISIASGATVRKSLGTMNLAGGSAISGAGTFTQTAGALNAIGDNSIGRLQLQGGTINRSADTVTKITDYFDWITGNVTGGGLLEIGGGGRLFGNVSVSDGPIRFGDGVNVSIFTLATSGSLALDNAAQASVRNGTTYEIAATGSTSNFGSHTSLTPGTFTVEAGGVLRKSGNGNHLITNSVVVINNGAIELNQGSLSFESNAVLENHGAVNVNAGNLYLIFGGHFPTNSGSVVVAPGATFHGNITNDSTGALLGAGAINGAVTLQPGGKIEAGVSEAATTMTLTNGLTMADGSGYGVTLFGIGPSAISTLAVTGDADIEPGANLRLDLGELSPMDVAALRAGIGEGNSRSYSVLTATGTISGGGFDNTSLAISNYGAFRASEWRFEALTTATMVELILTPVLIPVPGLPADFDEDGDVDADDLVRWTTGFEVAGATHMQGDADGDGIVDGWDFLAWQQQLGGGGSGVTSSTVPESPTAILLFLGFVTAGILTSQGGIHCAWPWKATDGFPRCEGQPLMTLRQNHARGGPSVANAWLSIARETEALMIRRVILSIVTCALFATSAVSAPITFTHHGRGSGTVR